MEETNPKDLIDITRLGEYKGYMSADIEKRFKSINDTIGTVPAKVGDQNVVDVIDYIQKKVALVNADATALAIRVSKNETEVQTNLPAYIDAAAAAAIAKVVGGASADFDTLQEFEQWLLSDSVGAKAMQNAIKVLQGTDGSTQTKESKSIPGVKLYIDALVDGKNVAAAVAEGELLLTAGVDQENKNKVIVGTTAKLQDAVARAEQSVQSVKEGTSVENYVVLTVGAKAANGSVNMFVDDSALAAKIEDMYASIKGDTTFTVKTVDDKLQTYNIASSNQIRAIFGLEPLS